MGCSIHKCAVAVDAECVTVVSSRNFSRAEMRPGGYLVSWHALTSASVSRLREIVACMALAMIGAKISRANPRMASGLPLSPWSPERRWRPPFHHIIRMAMSVVRATAPTSVTASVDTRMS